MNPIEKKLQEIIESPALKLLRQLEDSPVTKAQRILEDSPATKVQRILEDSPATKAQRVLEGSASRVQKIVDESPALKLLRQLEDSDIGQLYEKAQNDFLAGKLKISDENLIYDDEIIDSAEIQQNLNNYLESFSYKINFHSLDSAVEDIKKEIQSVKEPLRQKILSWIIIPLLISILLIPIENMFSSAQIKREKKIITKNLQKSSKKHIDHKLLHRYRIVQADKLNVRYKPKKKSNVVGKLYFSNIVKIISKKKKWRKIVWEDSEGSIKLTGWVYCKYLNKINKIK